MYCNISFKYLSIHYSQSEYKKTLERKNPPSYSVLGVTFVVYAYYYYYFRFGKQGPPSFRKPLGRREIWTVHWRNN